jgi:hypothetical protein
MLRSEGIWKEVSTYMDNIFTGKLLSRSTKLILYSTVIRPVVTYACETWITRTQIEQKRLIFERKTLRKIFGQNEHADSS